MEKRKYGRFGMASKAFIIGSEGLGKGDEQLGAILMASFLRLLGDSAEKPAQIIFLNGGVRLVCEGSKVLAHVKRLEEQGVEILACTTCLEYYDLMDKIAAGKPTTMVRSIESMFGYDTVVM